MDAVIEQSKVSVDDAIVEILVPAVQKSLTEIGKRVSFYPGGKLEYFFAVKLSEFSRDKQINIMRRLILINGNYKEASFFNVKIKKFNNGIDSSVNIYPEFSDDEKEIMLKVFENVIFSGYFYKKAPFLGAFFICKKNQKYLYFPSKNFKEVAVQNIDPMNKNKAIEILFPKILEALSANIPNNYWIQTDMGHGKYIQVKKLDTLDYAKKESFVFHLVKNYINMENDQICDIDYKRHTTSELMYKDIDLCFDEESLLAIVFIKTQKTSSELLMSVFS